MASFASAVHISTFFYASLQFTKRIRKHCEIKNLWKQISAAYEAQALSLLVASSKNVTQFTNDKVLLRAQEKGANSSGSLAFSRLSILLIILSFVDIFRDFNLQPGPFFTSKTSLLFNAGRGFCVAFFGIIPGPFAYIHTIFLVLHTRKYNFDISGESNQRNKFVKCFEHYFSGRKFIVYVQLSLSSFATLKNLAMKFFLLPTPQTRNKIKIFDPRRGGGWDEGSYEWKTFMSWLWRGANNCAVYWLFGGLRQYWQNIPFRTFFGDFKII